MKILTPDEIDCAAALLLQGELVAFPTETVYGLGAPVFSPLSIAKIFKAKGRPSDNPLIVHVSSLEEIERVAIEIPEVFFTLARHFFPGPLTLVLKKHPRVPLSVSGGLETVAVRMPDHGLAKALIQKVGQPLVAPSANVSGKPSATEVSHVLEDFQDQVAAVIDGGSCEIGVESTVVNLLESVPILLRPGKITQEEIEAVLGRPMRQAASSDQIASPGMKYRHYAPKARMTLIDDEEKLEAYLQDKMPHQVLLLSEKPVGAHQNIPLSCANLYKLLRDSDRMGVDEVVVFISCRIMENRALLNRLSRAQSTA